MTYFCYYQHFWGDNPPWSAVFNSTSCHVGNRSVESFVPNTSSYHCIVVYITKFLGGAYDTVVFRNVLLSRSSQIGVLCMTFASKWHIIINREWCGNSTSFTSYQAFLELLLCIYKSTVYFDASIMATESIPSSPPVWCVVSPPRILWLTSSSNVTDLRLRNVRQSGSATMTFLSVNIWKVRRVWLANFTHSMSIVA